MTTETQQIRLAQRPQGWVTPECFALHKVNLPALDEGQHLIRVLCLSVDPYMRGRMNAGKSYIAPFEVDQPIEGGGVGEVVQSRGPLAVGTRVVGMLPWQSHCIHDGKGLRPLPSQVSSTHALGVLGMPGLTAFVGMLDIGQPKAGDTVVVSAAAGAVGSVAGQLAKRAGARVIGSVGTAEKARFIQEELGFDAALNYRETQDLRAALKDACPDGIDVYFDNVGGAMLEAVLANLRTGARIPLCGMISVYNASEPQPGPRNLVELIRSRARMQGFLVSDHNDRFDDFIKVVGADLASGAIKAPETIVEGLANAPNAFIGMLKGENLGKQLVRLQAG